MQQRRGIVFVSYIRYGISVGFVNYVFQDSSCLVFSSSRTLAFASDVIYVMET